jgi:hypothetical protein
MAAMMGGWRDCLPDLAIGHELFQAVGPDKVTFRWVIRVRRAGGALRYTVYGRCGSAVPGARIILTRRPSNLPGRYPSPRPPVSAPPPPARLRPTRSPPPGHALRPGQQAARGASRWRAAAGQGRHDADPAQRPHRAKGIPRQRRRHPAAAGGSCPPGPTPGLAGGTGGAAVAAGAVTAMEVGGASPLLGGRGEGRAL